MIAFFGLYVSKATGYQTHSCGAACAATAFGVYTLVSRFAGNMISIVAAVIVAVIVYVLMLMLIKTFSKEELYMLPKGNNVVTILEKLHLIR